LSVADKPCRVKLVPGKISSPQRIDGVIVLVMALEHISATSPPRPGLRKEKRTLKDADFPSQEPFEEHVGETIRHLEARMALFLLTRTAHENISVGSDQFVYYDANDPKKCLAPDVFVKRNSRIKDFDTWLVWRRGAPDLAVEVVSVADRMKLSWKEKFGRYEACGVQELVRFDPCQIAPTPTMQVWDRINGQLVERAPDSLDTYECKTLGLYWTVEMSDEYGEQLRLCRDREGKELLPTPSETLLLLEQKLAKMRRARVRERHKRLLAEQKHRDESQARILAEQKHRDESQARILAEQKHREDTERLRRTEDELERLRAEMLQLRQNQ